MAILSDRLLSGIKRRIVLPASQPLFADSDLLQMASDTMRAKIVPLLKSVNQNFFVTKSVVPLVKNQQEYAIPYRSLGRTLRDLKLSDGATPQPNRRNVALVALEDEHYYRIGTLPQGFYFYGDKIVVVPMPLDSTYSLEFWWELPPAELIASSDAALVTAVGATTVTVSGVPSTLSIGGLADFIQGVSGCQTLAFDATISNIAGNVLTFGAGVIPSVLAAGDFVSPKGKSPLLQMTDEAYPYIETALAIRILKAIGDFDGAGRLDDDFKEEEKALKLILEPRITGEPIKIINRKGILRGYRGRFLTSRSFF